MSCATSRLLSKVILALSRLGCPPSAAGGAKGGLVQRPALRVRYFLTAFRAASISSTEGMISSAL
jgi:hypothetical protein